MNHHVNSDDKREHQMETLRMIRQDQVPEKLVGKLDFPRGVRSF